MSFMAAFFAINIAQFPRDEGGTLSLGYVSEIMCKDPNMISTQVTTTYIIF